MLAIARAAGVVRREALARPATRRGVLPVQYAAWPWHPAVHSPDAPECTSMETSGRTGDEDRRIALPGTQNLRDLGGYPAAGGTVRWRTLLRSDALHRLDDAGRAALAGLGLRTVIDLRTEQEVEAAPSALAGTGARTFHIPLFSDAAISRLPPERAAIYRYMIDDCAAAIAEAVGRLCASDALPGLIHCTAGKDRTGLVVALVLDVIGVPDEFIAADYAMSAAYLDPATAQAIRRVRAASGVGRWLDLGALGASPQVITTALARVRGLAGSASGYLMRHGLTRPELDQLRGALVVCNS
jgi:protein-tyrosine phosphatase